MGTGPEPGAGKAGDAKEIARVRARIDGIDDRIRALLNERARCALKIGEIKGAHGGEAPSFYRPERESIVLRRLRAENEGPLSGDDIERLFREVISCCLALEQPTSVAYLGPQGTYTEAAAIRQFGHAAHLTSVASIGEVFREVEADSARYGVVPVENSTEGVVNITLDCFLRSRLRICAEIEMPIHHALSVRPGTDADSISVIYSHGQSLAQCRIWLDAHFPKAERKPVASNAEAARIVAGEGGSAAIASRVAAERYGLTVLKRNIEDEPDNRTRFLVIGKDDVLPSGNDKTSILVSIRDRPGALFDILKPIHERGISLSRIETRPSRVGAWDYVFFIDLFGHRTNRNVKAALADIGSVAVAVKTLGSYPRALSQTI